MNHDIFVGAKVRTKSHTLRQGVAVVVAPNKLMCLDDLGQAFKDGAFHHIVPEGVTGWMTWNVRFPDSPQLHSYADFNLELIRVPTPWERPTRKISTEPSTANIDYHLTRPKRTLRRT